MNAYTYAKTLLETFKAIMDDGAGVGETFEKPALDDPAWVSKVRRHGQEMQRHARAGLGPQTAHYAL